MIPHSGAADNRRGVRRQGSGGRGTEPGRRDERKTANWQAVIDLGEETLKDTSKSLLVAVRMTEALTMRHGLAGVRDGFRLLRRMTEEAWDRLQPKVEEPDDLEIRAGMFNWL